MRKLAVALAAALAVGFQLPAIAQEAARPAAKPAAEKERAPSRVGLIDMATVFEGSAKFKVLRDELAA
ncbi:MAG: hypothetical protein ACK5AN_04365, partial [Planctomyces sp.]